MTEETQAAPDELEQQIADALKEDSATSQDEQSQQETQEGQEQTETPEGDGSEYVETDNEKVQARFNKLTWEKNELQRQLEAERKKNEEAAQQSAAPEVSEKPKLDDFKLEDFDFDSEARQTAFAEKLAEWTAEQKVSSYFENQQKQQLERQQQEAQQKLNDSYIKETEAYVEKNPAYYKDIEALPLLDQQKLDLIRQAGPKYVHYLSKNPEEASKFADADFGNAAMQLGMITARLSTPQENKKQSSAPDPVETIQGSGKHSKNWDEMSMEEIYNT